MSDFTVFTIADEKFLPGLAGLINSLRAGGFRGPIKVGAPQPLSALADLEDVHVIDLSSDPLWLGFLKAALILTESSGGFIFFDADIVLGDPAFLNDLAALTKHGPLLTLDGLVNPRDPRRLGWSSRLSGTAPRGDAWAYYNGGFLAGRLSRDRALLEAWDQAMHVILKGVPGYYADPQFPFGDQDVLNALLQSRTDSISALQFPDWWSAVSPFNSFLHVGARREPAFYHSTGPKPWDLKTVPPRNPNPYESLWFRHVIRQPTPLDIGWRLPTDVHQWLAGTWTGRVRSRGNRLRQRLAGR